jgi:hypothetical protein
MSGKRLCKRLSEHFLNESERLERLDREEELEDPLYVTSEEEEEGEEEDEEDDEEEEGGEEDDEQDKHPGAEFYSSTTLTFKGLTGNPNYIQLILLMGDYSYPVLEAPSMSAALTCTNTTQLICCQILGKEVFELAARLPNLREFEARRLRVRSLDEYAPLWTAPLKALRRLVIDTGDIDDEHCKMVAELALRCKLLELDVSNQRFGPDGVIYLFDTLAKSRSIEVLSVRNANLQGTKVRFSLGYLIKSTRTLRELDVESFFDGFTQGIATAKLQECVEKAMEFNCSIEHVRFPMPSPRLLELFERSKFARDACRDACIEFLLCRRQIGLVKPIAVMIAQFIWSTRGCIEWAEKFEEEEED